MKKFLFIIATALLFYACEEIPDQVVDNLPDDNYAQVIDVRGKSELNYEKGDTVFITSIKIQNDRLISRAEMNIFLPDGNLFNLNEIELKDDGNLSASGDTIANDGWYSAKVSLTDSLPTGQYIASYYLVEKGEYKFSANYNFKYFPKNFVPEISNLLMPDSVERDNQFSFSVEVTDANGLGDIEKVYYELFRPSGDKVTNSTGESQFPLFDNGGNPEDSGDLVKGDGIYTVRLTFPGAVESGIWRFEFAALDRSGAGSNIIIKNLLVK